jgi:hypothetical protein
MSNQGADVLGIFSERVGAFVVSCLWPNAVLWCGLEEALFGQDQLEISIQGTLTFS